MAIIGSKISSVSTSGEIVGISVEEVATVLGEPIITDNVTGVTGDAAGYLCGSSKIKKWNIHKPVNKSKYSKLDEADYRGESTDIANGIIYGLRAGVARTNPASLHSADWEYVGRPDPINRLGDFDGYDHSIEAPNLSGTGLYNGQRVDYASECKVQLVWGSKEGAINLAQVFSAQADYSKMYLCALVGTYGRCCINNDIGGVYPIIYNSVQGQSFSIPAVSPIVSYDNSRQVTLFFASQTDVDILVPAMKSSWVDFSTAPAFNEQLISVPNQVNMTINFVRNVLEYITSFDMQYSKGALSFQFTQGPDWNSASGYRIVISVTDASGQTGPITTIDVGLDGMFLTPIIATIMSNAGFVQTGFATTYTFKATFQVLLGGSYTDTIFSDTETITLTSW